MSGTQTERAKFASDEWRLELRALANELIFRRRINGHSVVVYYGDECHWYVFSPVGTPEANIDIEAKGESNCLIQALNAAETAARAIDRTEAAGEEGVKR